MSKPKPKGKDVITVTRNGQTILKAKRKTLKLIDKLLAISPAAASAGERK